MSERHHAGPWVAPARFFSSEGRIGAIRFVVMTGAIVSIFYMVAWSLATFDTATFPLLGAAGGAALAKLFAEAGRRCHDVNWSAAIGALVLVGTFLGLFAVLSLLRGGVMAIAVGAVATLAFVITFLRPGQTTANIYGEPPSGVLRAGRLTDGRARYRSLVWAAISILGCATIGLAIQLITDQIRADRETRNIAATRQGITMASPGKIEV